MDIDTYKTLDDLILTETNIKVISRTVGVTEEGTLTLDYTGSNRTYEFVLPNRRQAAKDETVILFLKSWYEKNL